MPGCASRASSGRRVGWLTPAVLAACVAMGWAATARAAEPAFIPSCGGSSGGQLTQHPRSWNSGCGPLPVAATAVRWAGWGGASAVGHGQVRLTCVTRFAAAFPDARCAAPDSAPTGAPYPVKLVASGLRRCDGRASLPAGAARLYTRVRVSVRWPAGNPFGMAPGWRAGRTITTEDCDADQADVVHMLGAFCRVGPDLPHPASWEVGCVAAGVSALDLTWHRWGSATAIGVGREPTSFIACFDAKTHRGDPRLFPAGRCTAPAKDVVVPQQDYPVRLVASDIRRCADGRGGRVPTYTRVVVQVRWPAGNPFGVAPGWHGGTPITNVHNMRPSSVLDCA